MPPARGGCSTRSRRRFVDEGDIYELGEALGQVAEAAHVDLGGQSDAHGIGTDALGSLQAVHLLHDGLGFVAMSARQPEIWLMAHSPGVLAGVWERP